MSVVRGYFILLHLFRAIRSSGVLKPQPPTPAVDKRCGRTLLSAPLFVPSFLPTFVSVARIRFVVPLGFTRS